MKLQQEIVLSKNHIDILTRHAQECAPNESCAILFGRIEGKRVIIREIFLTKNTENSPVTFTISNQELIQAYSEAEKRKLDVIGIFHSHPHSAAYPSATDKKYMESNPVPWIIFSNVENKFEAYVFESGIIPVVVTIS
ncbi:MAG: peptidase [Thaumarchaeota archaeon 13_1_40CM_4_38_7]|nr:MAG: peptidase [Thaumarchaeota archaeon 13_1_40CM_4_38_7]OLC91302.1 MAG: peptidase [Thaumarchaeota archaeon 13_1_40CM_3_38_6]OLD28998.1 MAG: peptidase [Thaumarchaeota archaeon 13_1_40CM_2_39_7]